MKLHKWAQDMAEQKASGLSQKKWCKMKGIPTTTFQYRCRKANPNIPRLYLQKQSLKHLPNQNHSLQK